MTRTVISYLARYPRSSSLPDILGSSNKMTDVDDFNSPSSTAHLLPIAILIDELKHEDMSVRLSSVRRVRDIAAALGPTRTRNELVPYLNEFIEDEDDVLLALSDELGHLIDFVGGVDHAHCLLVPLETLSEVEESAVRKQAINSIIRIAAVLSPQQIQDSMLTLTQRLAGGEWFTSRTTACSLITPIYPRVNDAAKTLLRSLFANLCEDSSPMVRRAACSQIGSLAHVVEAADIHADLFASFKSLANDDQDSVRLLAVDSCIKISQKMTNQEAIKYMLPIITMACQDKSWRVRYMAADKFVDLCAAVGEAVARTDMINCFVALLADVEPEVRTVAASKLIDIAKLMDKADVVSRIIPPVREIAADTSQYARAALASVIMGLSHILDRNDVFEILLPLFLQLLRDESSEVRLNIISKLDAVNDVIGLDFFTNSLLSTIIELALDKKWRVRLAILQHIPLLAEQLGHEFFEQRLRDLCISWLGDEVFSIREAATNNLTRLTKVFGVVWSREHIIPRIVDMCNHTNYLRRITALAAIVEVSSMLDIETFVSDLIPTIVMMCDDPVPNVRFNVAKSIGKLCEIEKLDAVSFEGPVRDSLSSLMTDSDADVRYFADQALKQCTQILKDQHCNLDGDAMSVIQTTSNTECDVDAMNIDTSGVINTSE